MNHIAFKKGMKVKLMGPKILTKQALDEGDSGLVSFWSHSNDDYRGAYGKTLQIKNIVKKTECNLDCVYMGSEGKLVTLCLKESEVVMYLPLTEIYTEY